MALLCPIREVVAVYLLYGTYLCASPVPIDGSIGRVYPDTNNENVFKSQGSVAFNGGKDLQSNSNLERRKRETYLNAEDLRAHLQENANLARTLDAFTDEQLINGVPRSAVAVVGGDGDNKVGELFLRKTRPDSKLRTDFGHGSRISAGTNLANDLVALTLYGSYGPGRKKRNELVGDVVPAPWVIKRFASDSGYGSRVGAGSNIARSLVTKDLLYGGYGPGK